MVLAPAKKSAENSVDILASANIHEFVSMIFSGNLAPAENPAECWQTFSGR